VIRISALIFPIQLEVNRINSIFRTENSSEVLISLIDLPFAIFLLLLLLLLLIIIIIIDPINY